jgi:serine/threonine protein kinase
MFTNFLSGLLKIDPEQRWTAWQALRHPFITGAEYDGPYVPDPDPLKHMLRETSAYQPFGKSGSLVSPSILMPKKVNGYDVEFGEFGIGNGAKGSSFVPRFSEVLDISGFPSHPISSSLPVIRSEPQTIPLASEMKEPFMAHSFGDGSEIGSNSLKDSYFLSSGSSFSSQFSYHSPYTYGQEIPRLTNFPADYSWSERKTVGSDASPRRSSGTSDK